MGYKRLKNYSITRKSLLQQSRKDGCGGEIGTLHSRSLRMKSSKRVGKMSTHASQECLRKSVLVSHYPLLFEWEASGNLSHFKILEMLSLFGQYNLVMAKEKRRNLKMDGKRGDSRDNGYKKSGEGNTFKIHCIECPKIDENILKWWAYDFYQWGKKSLKGFDWAQSRRKQKDNHTYR